MLILQNYVECSNLNISVISHLIHQAGLTIKKILPFFPSSVIKFIDLTI